MKHRHLQSHIRYVAEVIIDAYQRRGAMGGLELVDEAPVPKAFTVKMPLVQQGKMF